MRASGHSCSLPVAAKLRLFCRLLQSVPKMRSGERRVNLHPEPRPFQASPNIWTTAAVQAPFLPPHSGSSGHTAPGRGSEVESQEPFSVDPCRTSALGRHLGKRQSALAGKDRQPEEPRPRELWGASLYGHPCCTNGVHCLSSRAIPVRTVQG